jgi:hypothetical protein
MAVNFSGSLNKSPASFLVEHLRNYDHLDMPLRLVRGMTAMAAEMGG